MYFHGKYHPFKTNHKFPHIFYLVVFVQLIMFFSHIVQIGTLIASNHSETITIREGANHEH